MSLRTDEYRFFPPEIIAAENGFILKSYDSAADITKHVICKDVAEIRAALDAWAESVCADIRTLVTRKIGIATAPKEVING